jgi:hypothetical protein
MVLGHALLRDTAGVNPDPRRALVRNKRVPCNDPRRPCRRTIRARGLIQRERAPVTHAKQHCLRTYASSADGRPARRGISVDGSELLMNVCPTAGVSDQGL